MTENENKIDEGEGEGEGKVINCLNGTISWWSYTQSLSVRSSDRTVQSCLAPSSLD